MAGLEDTIAVLFEIELGGKTCKAGMPNLEDLAIIRQAAKEACEKESQTRRKQMIADAKACYPGGIPAEVFASITIPVAEKELDDWQGTPEGMGLLLHRCLIKHDRTLTLEKVKEAVKSMDFVALAKKLKGPEPKNVPTPPDSK